MTLLPRIYLLVAIVFAVMCVFSDDVYFQVIWFWAAGSFFSVALAYVLNKPSIFRKRANGEIPFAIRWLLLPFLWTAQIYNAWARYHDKVPAVQEIEPGLFLARRLFPSDIHFLKRHNVAAVLDVTAEFDSLHWTRLYESIDYLNVPILDHHAPTEAQIIKTINWVHTHRKDGRSVLIHCALGRGRSVFMLAAYLLSIHRDRLPLSVFKQIKAIRHCVNLNKHQLHVLTQMHHQNVLKVRNTAYLIVNPVAGTRQWQDEKSQILEQLSPFYRLTIKETTTELNGTYWAKEALKEHPDVIIACGGDGTVSEVAQALINTKMPLGIIPLGTANALSYALGGLSAKLNPISTACLALIDGHSIRIDTAKCNGEVMLLLCGLGFEQQMIVKADRNRKNSSGQLAYLQGLSEALSENIIGHYRISIDEMPYMEIQTPSLTIANAAPVTTLLAQGKGAPDLTDGILDVTWLASDRLQILNLIELLKHGMMDRLEEHEYSGVHYQPARRIDIRSLQSIDYVIDGEPRAASSLLIEVLPKSLQVIVPMEPDL